MIHELPWITIFGSLVTRFANDFHSWLRHSWKPLANRLTRDPKIVIHGNSCIFLYITAIDMALTNRSPPWATAEQLDKRYNRADQSTQRWIHETPETFRSRWAGATSWKCIRMGRLQETFLYIIDNELCHIWINTLRPRQNGYRLADETFKCILLNENVFDSD